MALAVQSTAPLAISSSTKNSSPDIDRLTAILDSLEPVPSSDSRECLISLARHRPQQLEDFELSVFSLDPMERPFLLLMLSFLFLFCSPRQRAASVLALLSVESNGEIQVTLTTRSKSLRAFFSDPIFVFFTCLVC
jgi:hypothetical protein